MKVLELHRKKASTINTEEMEKKIKTLRKENDKLVKGRFEFIDAQGGWIDFHYRIFPGEPIRTFTLVHGETTELPMGVVKHINNTLKKVRKLSPELKMDERGVPSSYEVQSRIRFTPVDFL